MSDDIFENEARKYWDRSLPIVPVNGKAPALSGWTGLLGGIPGEEKQKEWLTSYANKNIGLLLGAPLGEEKVLVALDVDDDRLLNLVLQLLGLNRSERRAVLAGKRGKKGATIFVRAPKLLKSTVIKGAGELGNIDFLAGGKMTVMPPSIHPETGKPYENYGKSLLEVDFADLPEITDQHIKLLKAAISSENAIVLISGKATHDAGVALVAVLVRAGATDEEIEDILAGLLPGDYAGDSLQELPEWIRSAREKGFAETEGEDDTQSAKMVKLALAEGMYLFRDEATKDVAMATLPHTGSSIAYRVTSGSVKLWLRNLAYRSWGKPIASQPLNEAIATLEAIGLFDGPPFPVFARVAGNGHAISMDLGHDDGSTVLIEPDGWTIEATVAHKFIRGAGFGELPLPVSGSIEELYWFRSFLGLDQQNYRLLLAFLINALRPTGPYFILLVEGEQGSGKSFFCEVIKRIIDPNTAMRMRLPDKPQDLMIQAQEYRLLSFDNASGMSAEMSDALCALSTGGGIAVRKLYTDGDLYVMNYTRPFMINGIGGYASRPDLMERAIPIKLSPMSEGGRKTEDELRAEFNQRLPGVLGALYDAVAHALREFDGIEPPRHLRMADSARWISAAEGGLGEEAGAIIDAIAAAQDEFFIEQVNDNALVVALRRIAGPLGYEDYFGGLFVKIMEQDDAKHHRSLPKSPSQLSNQLIRMRPAMEKAGIVVEFLPKDRKGRKVRIRLVDPGNAKPPFLV
ncbi:bifunctional DNA primase/polymerase [Roseibium aggregatum]|uniref:Bifunctional DNA primase/polymerase n=1 Tax=Roseibium aggregatum TaxID=187304 RepID=A0A939J749_9HYPH|nr:bifunctional DNA primase/polymerase [Roseibium aggregatum]MBN9673454.1 bifunctional DNA primase/polymerase [Roseibium aggregatum]